MSEIKTLSKIKKYNMGSFWSQLLGWIFGLVLIFIGVGNTRASYSGDYDSNLTITGLVLTVVGGLIFVITYIVSLVYCILSIVQSSNLRPERKSIYLIFSILSIIFLGIIANLINWIMANKDIKILENGEDIGPTPSGSTVGGPSNPSLY